jgi:UDP-N-acetylmuramoyl-tripeptide--D-alanyl-D-alanine ligase
VNAASPGSPWLSVFEVLEVTGGRLWDPIPPDEAPCFTACAIDSRALTSGELFVPLPGTRVDGHEFVGAALTGKAGGSFVQSGKTPASGWPRLGKPVIEVSDPLSALQAVGRHCRERAAIPVVAVTGSNGKTTTKEMIAAVLGTSLAVHKNVGNLNNHIGVPLTLSRLRPEHQALVIELGMSARGEIGFLASLCLPKIGVLTNASAAHLAQLGTVDEVALAKSELAEALPGDGLLVLNADDPRLWRLNRDRPVPIRSYALDNPEADLRPTSLRTSADGGVRFVLSYGTEVTLALLGRHNVRNALAAILVGDAFGISRRSAALALAALPPARHRLELLRSSRGVCVLDDAYNANPASMREALLVLATIETRGARRAVLGDMLELGPGAAALHEEVGRLVPRDAWLYAAGEHRAAIARGARAAGVPENHVCCFEDVPSMAAAVVADAGSKDLVLVKASRGMRLERVVDALAPGRAGSPDALTPAGRD